MDNKKSVAHPSTGNEFRKGWGWLLALGILLVILGFIGIEMVVSLTFVSMLFFGVLLIIAGISFLIDVFYYRNWRSALWHGLTALLYILGGVMIIYDPLLASTFVTAIIACALIIIGVIRIIMSIQLFRTSGWGWMLLAGITSFLLGCIILIHWPISGLWFIGLFIAIEMMIAGWTYIFLSLSIRRKLPE